MGRSPLAEMLKESRVPIQWILWTHEIFTCKHFGSRLFGYLSLFNTEMLQVKGGFSQALLTSRSPGKGIRHVTCVLTVIKPTLSLRHDSKLLEGRTLSQSHWLAQKLVYLCP